MFQVLFYFHSLSFPLLSLNKFAKFLYQLLFMATSHFEWLTCLDKPHNNTEAALSPAGGSYWLVEDLLLLGMQYTQYRAGREPALWGMQI